MKVLSELPTSVSSLLFTTFKKALPLLIVLPLLTSCASIVSRSKWNVPITSNPSSASFSVVNLRNNKEVFTGTTPATANLKSGGGFFTNAKYRVDFTMPGYKPVSANLTAKFNGWYVGNLVFGGLLGLLIVDPATGAMYSLNKMSVHGELSQDLGSIEEHQLRVYNLNDIPADWKEHLVRVR